MPPGGCCDASAGLVWRSVAPQQTPVLYRPTDEQEAIIAHPAEHHARILAGPGTGKSATMVAMVDRLLAGSPAPRVKLLTFTGAATAS